MNEAGNSPWRNEKGLHSGNSSNENCTVIYWSRANLSINICCTWIRHSCDYDYYVIQSCSTETFHPAQCPFWALPKAKTLLFCFIIPGEFPFRVPASECFEDTALTEQGYDNRLPNELHQACCMFGLPADAFKSHTYLRNSLLHCNLMNAIPTNPQFDWHHGKCGVCISFHSPRNNDLAACV